MVRGRLILSEDPVETVKACLKGKESSKGRNSDLLNKRNTVIIYRYYFYKTFSKWSYEDIIERVSEEMFLSNRTITDILTAQVQKLKEIKAEQPPIARFNRKYPQYNWSISAF